MRGFLSFAALSGLLALPAQLYADVAPPPPPRQVSAALEVTVDRNAKKCELSIPKAIFSNLGDLGMAPERGERQSVGSPWGSRSLFAAFAMSAAMISGVVVVRSRSTGSKVALVMLVFGLGMIGQASADLLPFGPRTRPPRRPEPQAQMINIVVVERGNTVKLSIPASYLPAPNQRAGGAGRGEGAS
ncbi:MAG: hypothetical protein KDB14_10325, partial [Planctomycetales bacterium]|nr:hypothetical protein [Planctomycetales bacterium]